MAKKDGGPAFPRTACFDRDLPEYDSRSQDGMTLRDYFAAKAIGLFPLNGSEVIRLEGGASPNHAFVARFCYALADAMLAERSRED